MKLGIRTSIIYIVVALLTVQNMYGQMPRLYTSSQGLKTANTRGVNIDSHGMAWIAGRSSIGIFGGRNFKYVPVQDPVTGSLLFQTSYRVKEFKEGKYWVCTSHGLFLLDAKTTDYSRINVLNVSDSTYVYATNDIIEYIKPNKMLVTTDGFGVYILDIEKMQIDLSETQILSAKMKNNNFVRSPFIDKQKRLWYFSNVANELIGCHDLNTMQEHKYKVSPDAATLLNGANGGEIIDVEGQIYFGTSNGVLIFDPKTDELTVMKGTESLNVTSLIYSKFNDLLIGTDGKGICKKGKGQELQQYNNISANFEMSYGKVVDMDEDVDGDLVVMLYEKGLVVIPSPSECFHYHAISPQANGKNATTITSMTIDKNDNYWVGTDGCGVFTSDGLRLATAHTVNEGLNCKLVQNVTVDKHNTVWVATYGGGVQYYEGGRWTTGGWLEQLKNSFCMTMYYDVTADKIYLGTNGDGVYILDIANRKVEKLTKPEGYNPWISALLVDSKGNLWIGTSLALMRYNPKTGKVTSIDIEGDRLSNANCVVQIGNEIYVGADRGLAIFDVNNYKQRNYTKANGLTTNIVKAISATDTHIWVATLNNIASIDKKTGVIHNYSSYGGYSVGEFHANSIVRPSEKFILFGGGDGIICFTPKLITNRTQALKEVFFTDFSTPRNKAEMGANIMYAKEIDLDHDDNSFTISFTSPEFGDPYRIKYDYILEGLEKEWHTNTNVTSVNYSSLDPGKYTFVVKAHYEDEPSTYIEKKIIIYVKSPWYSSTIAYIVYFLLLLALAIYINKLYMARRKEKEIVRRSEELDRMREAKLKMFTSITHELRSPLMMIESPLRQLMIEDKDKEHHSLYTVMMRNCERLLGIVKQITDIRKIDSGQFQIKLEEHDFVEYADDVFEQFKGVAAVKNISFVIEHSVEEIPMMMDETHFEKIITNLLSNAFKFTPEGGKVIVRSGVVGSNVELRFYNSGSHIDEDDMSHLWERFYQGNSAKDATGSGIGLNLVYELTKLHHGTINVMNIQPDGVEFTLHFPYFNSQPATSDSGSPSDGRTKYTVLLVDDDSEIIDFVRTQLQNEYNVITAFSGKSGWKQVITKRPDVVVTDYRMPDGNGVELSQLIKSNPETDNTPIILLTGEGDDMLQLHSLNIQVDHYLEKPVNVMVLRSAINQVLRVRENLRNKVRRTELGTEMPKVTIENADDKLFSKINEAIKKHLDDSEYSIMQLSEDVGISRIHLNRKMKERYGMSPSVFLRSFRLKQAASLLINNKVNVSEVAYRVGFSSHSYFTVSFHDYFGMSPKEFVIFYSEEANSDALKKLLE